ncbi:hypothetical protein BDZ97DRAFT_1054801 [Flammula alnicola]|nr:hypothetical protein BDZ97DRAFT_1054801 [Flammula alnicola]
MYKLQSDMHSVDAIQSNLAEDSARHHYCTGSRRTPRYCRFSKSFVIVLILSSVWRPSAMPKHHLLVPSCHEGFIRGSLLPHSRASILFSRNTQNSPLTLRRTAPLPQNLMSLSYTLEPFNLPNAPPRYSGALPSLESLPCSPTAVRANVEGIPHI